LRYVQAQLVQTMQNVSMKSISGWPAGCCCVPIEHVATLPEWRNSIWPAASGRQLGMLAAHGFNCGGNPGKKLIIYIRGVIRIDDCSGLEAEAYGCLQVIRDDLNRYTEVNVVTVV
jgi:hypothetical protein